MCGYVLPTKTQVAEQEGLPSVVAKTIRGSEIDGSTLNQLTAEDMEDLADNNLDRKKLRGALTRGYVRLVPANMGCLPHPIVTNLLHTHPRPPGIRF